MTRAAVVTVLRGMIRQWQIDPHDAGLVLEQVPREGIDSETLGDFLDGAGYPELAARVYETQQEGSA